MNPILYTAVESAFNSNGIGILRDAAQCDIIQELNGQFELEMQYPVGGLHFADIAIDRIILAKVDPVSDLQPFRIYRITKPMKGVTTVYARHIAYDLMGITVAPFASQSCAAALQDLKNNATTACPFEFWTDKSTAANMTVSVPTSIWAQMGGSSGSVLDVYGGEYEFDRYNVKLHNRRGADRGVSIRYGKNLTSLEQDENCANVFTGVHPYWTDIEGSLVQLPEKILHAEGNFAKTKIKPLDLSLAFETQPTEEQLRTRARKYMKDNNIGIPPVSWKVEFVQLEQTEEYKGKALLERVLLGDTVAVEFAEMGVSASARAVSMRYDSLRERYKSVSLGSVRSNIADTIAQQQQEIAQKPSVSLLQSIMMTLTATILGAKGGAVRLLDTDGDKMPDTLYVADNADPALAVKVWRWNYEGWAGSKNGYNGPFVLGATLEDGLLAEAVTAAKLVAGTIQSKDGTTFFLDLDKGILKMKATEFSVSGQTVDQIAAGKAEEAKNAAIESAAADASSKSAESTRNANAYTDALNNSLSQLEILKRLTNGGTDDAIILKDSKILISASAILTGVLDAALVTVKNLVAEKLRSVSGTSVLDLDGATIRLNGKNGTTFEVYNWEDGIASMMFHDLTSGDSAQIRASFIGLGGDSGISPDLALFARSFTGAGSRLVIEEIQHTGDSAHPFKFLGKTASWKPNGDGTFTLIGS